MAEIFSWVKLCLENWKVLLGIMTLIASLFGNGLLAAANTEKDEMIDGQKKAIKVYSNLAYQANVQLGTKTRIIRKDCNCKEILTNHIKDYH